MSLMDTKLFSPSQPVLSRPPHTLFLVDNLLLACLAEPRVASCLLGGFGSYLGNPWAWAARGSRGLGAAAGAALLLSQSHGGHQAGALPSYPEQESPRAALLFFFACMAIWEQTAAGSVSVNFACCSVCAWCFFFPLGCVTKLLQAWNRQMGQGRGASALPPAVTSSC